MRLAIVGGGIAGLACADRLREDGIESVVFDKGRGPGGRMSTRRIDTAQGTVSFDHGAQYFTARDPLFKAQVDSWAASGIVARWQEAGHDAWVGSPAMNSPLRHMAARHDVRFQHHVHGLMRDAGEWWLRVDSGREGPFDTVVVALPAEQAVTCLGLADFGMAIEAMNSRSQPCWTAMIVFGGRLDIPADHLRGDGVINWACRNSVKPGREGPEAWVVQGSGSWSAAHLADDPDTVAATLLAILMEHCGSSALPPILSLTAHLWRFAMTQGTDRGALWNPALGLGACGDWLLGPRVELAWLSGNKLGTLIANEATRASEQCQDDRRQR